MANRIIFDDEAMPQPFFRHPAGPPFSRKFCYAVARPQDPCSSGIGQIFVCLAANEVLFNFFIQLYTTPSYPIRCSSLGLRPLLLSTHHQGNIKI